MSKENDGVVLAKNIDDCSVCPLYKHDCKGGWTSGGGGEPIEPPCCSWNGDEEIYEGMYENNCYEPSEREFQWAKEYELEKELRQKEKRATQEKEEAQRKINKISKYGNAKIKDSGNSICDYWYCPHCNRWFHACNESWSNGIGETSCNYCGERLAHSPLLD